VLHADNDVFPLSRAQDVVCPEHNNTESRILSSNQATLTTGPLSFPTMGCGSSSLIGDSFDGIDANKARKVGFHGESSTYRHDNIYSSSKPATSSDPTKGPYIQTQREEPLRDIALPTTSDGHYRKPSYHGKGAYQDLTLSSDDYPTTSGAANVVKEKRGRQVRM
jgi:hypothetical protein